MAVIFVNKEAPGVAEYEFEKMATNYNLKVKINHCFLFTTLSIYINITEKFQGCMLENCAGK